MKTTALITAIATAIVLSSGVHAQSTATPGIDQQQLNQQARINQGVASGALTPRETAVLQHQQNRIANDKDHAKADGVVTPQERRRLRHEQRRASRNIFHKKHNRHHRDAH